MTNKFSRIDNYAAVNALALKFAEEYMQTPEAQEDFAEMTTEYPKMYDDVKKMYIQDHYMMEVRRLVWPIMDAEKVRKANIRYAVFATSVVILAHIIASQIF